MRSCHRKDGLIRLGKLCLLAAGFGACLYSPCFAHDSVFVPGMMGWAQRSGDQVNDLDYSKDFSAEVLIYIPPNNLQGRFAVHLAKGDENVAVGRGWSIHTGYNIWPSYAKPVYCRVSDSEWTAEVKLGPYQGFAHVVMTWDRTNRILKGYLNGGAQIEEARESNLSATRIESAGRLKMAANGRYPMPNPWGGTNTDVHFARLWNRKLTESEVKDVYKHWLLTRQQGTPSGFNREGLVSEWLMGAHSAVSGGTLPIIEDNVGPNDLHLFGDAKHHQAVGALSAVYPAMGANGVGPSEWLVATGGRASLVNPVPPLQFFFELDEVPTFDSPALKKSGWITAYGIWQPVMKPETTYYWRVKCSDSGNASRISSFTSISSFTTRKVQNWYVRPRAPLATYGTEDGKSYATAWNGLTAIRYQTPGEDDGHGVTWGPGGVESGDTLFVCGEHIANRQPQKLFYRTAIAYIGVDGFSEDCPVTIKMDWKEESGTIWGFFKYETPPYVWSGPNAEGLYQTNGKLRTPLFTGLERGEPIFLKQVDPNLSPKPEAYWYEDSGCFYVKLPDGENPTDRIFENMGGYQLLPHRRNSIRFNKCTFKGVAFRDDLSKGEKARSKHVVWDGCDMEYGPRLIELHQGNDHWVVRSSTLQYAASAIYALNRPDRQSADHVTIEHNVIRNLGLFENGYYDGDHHGIGAQGCSNWMIQNNYISNTGTAIAFWNGAGEGKYMRNNTIRWNFIKNAKKVENGTLGDGIKISGSSGNTIGLRTGFRIYGNIILNTDGYGIGSNNPDPMMVYNNLIYNTGDHAIREHIASPYAPAMAIKNNIILYPKGQFIYLSGADCTSGCSKVAIENNLFWPNSITRDSFYLRCCGGRLTLTCLKRMLGSSNPGFYADPLLHRFPPSEPQDVRLTSGSKAIDNGSVTIMETDVFGRDVPNGSAPDIGPHEWHGDPIPSVGIADPFDRWDLN